VVAVKDVQEVKAPLVAEPRAVVEVVAYEAILVGCSSRRVLSDSPVFEVGTVLGHSSPRMQHLGIVGRTLDIAADRVRFLPVNHLRRAQQVVVGLKQHFHYELFRATFLAHQHRGDCNHDVFASELSV